MVPTLEWESDPVIGVQTGRNGLPTLARQCQVFVAPRFENTLSAACTKLTSRRFRAL